MDILRSSPRLAASALSPLLGCSFVCSSPSGRAAMSLGGSQAASPAWKRGPLRWPIGHVVNPHVVVNLSVDVAARPHEIRTYMEAPRTPGTACAQSSPLWLAKKLPGSFLPTGTVTAGAVPFRTGTASQVRPSTLQPFALCCSARTFVQVARRGQRGFSWLRGVGAGSA